MTKQGNQNVRMTDGHFVHLCWEDEFSEVRITCGVASFEWEGRFSLVGATQLRDALDYIIHEKDTHEFKGKRD